MTITRLNDHQVAIKTNQTMVTISDDKSIVIGTHEIQGPGEYDVAGVGLQMYDGTTMFLVENLRVEVIFDQPELNPDEELIEPDIFLVMTQYDKTIGELVKKVDPRAVILFQPAGAELLTKQEGDTVENQTTIKLTAQTLPVDSRQYFVLAE